MCLRKKYLELFIPSPMTPMHQLRSHYFITIPFIMFSITSFTSSYNLPLINFKLTFNKFKLSPHALKQATIKRNDFCKLPKVHLSNKYLRP